jgi:hypothetical protein
MKRQIHIDGPWFKDEYGRIRMLRGVNVSGSSKIPSAPNPIHKHFYNHRNVSFVDRPFPLEEADEHFARLRQWGFTFLRFVVTWEALEHEGPGCYDEAYLDYLYQVVRRAGEYDLDLFIDPHQDLWSRMSGGDGAPGWTFDVVGMDIRLFYPTHAALVHPFDPQPLLSHWSMNYTRFAAATMFTLFFGGDDFAPKTMIEGEPVQEYLQRHYINAFRQVAQRLKGLPNVVGFGSMNEPSRGYIGLSSLHRHEGHLGLRIGPSPTPLQTMLLAAGYPQEVEIWRIGWRGLRSYGTAKLNAEGVNVWKPGYDCIWRENGVWDINSHEQPCLLRPHHFSYVRRGQELHRVDFGQDYLRPFINRFSRAIRTVEPASIMFVETMPYLDMPHWSAHDAPNIVNATHWYDYMTLFIRLYLPFLNVDVKKRRFVFGNRRIQRMFHAQLAAIKRDSMERLGGVPTLIGEYGVPFNMPLNLNFWLRWFGLQAWAMDTSFQAIESNLLNATLWNYTPDNTNHLGDHWNTEDFSLFSRDQQTSSADINSGGRVLVTAVRPYPRSIAGEPLHMAFDWRKRRFTFAFRHNADVSMPTEIFVPHLHYPHGYEVDISDGTYEKDAPRQLLRYWYGRQQDIHTIHLFPSEL